MEKDQVLAASKDFEFFKIENQLIGFKIRPVFCLETEQFL